jgi:hypothetical protein
MLVQSALGWLFRKISENLTEFAARQFLKRCMDEGHGLELKKVLGKYYRVQHEIFLPYIPPDQLQSKAYLAAGGNGEVWSAVWNRPSSYEFGPAHQIYVALKRIPFGNLSKEAALRKFLLEV